MFSDILSLGFSSKKKDYAHALNQLAESLDEILKTLENYEDWSGAQSNST